MITLDKCDKISITEEIDDVVSAKILDLDTDPKLCEIIKRCMMHGPCGSLNPNSPCIVDGKCSKKYPKRFNQQASLDNNGYPTYMRRNDGRTVKIGYVELNIRWVVPCGPFLSRKYNAHLNIEICSQIRVIKYL